MGMQDKAGWISRRLVAGAMALLACAWVLAPNAAQAGSNIGTGVVEGSLSLNPGIPTLTETPTNCISTFSLTGDAPAFAFNTVITGFVGVADLSGSGTVDGCAKISVSTGSLVLGVSGTGPTGSKLDCDGTVGSTTLSGNFTRVGAVTLVTLGGTCVVNNYALGTVNFTSIVNFTPTTVGWPVSTDATSADFAGLFEVSPAS